MIAPAGATALPPAVAAAAASSAAPPVQLAPHAPNDARVHDAAQGPIHELEILFDPDPLTPDVFIIHANTAPPNRETAIKVEELRRRLREGDKEVSKYSHSNPEIEKLVEAEFAKITDGVPLNNGKVVVRTPIGAYNLGISENALKALLRVKILTSHVAQDRIISVIEQGAKGTHDFYQLHNTDATNPVVLLHVHKGIKGAEDYKGHLLGEGALGIAYKALDLASRQVRVAKENKAETPEEKLKRVENENHYSQRVNASNTSPGLAKKPILTFSLYRPGRGGIGLVQHFYEKGNLYSYVMREKDAKGKPVEGQLSLREKMNGIYALLQAGENLSLKDMVHLDIKLGNVFMNENNQLVIADFDEVWDLEDEELFIDRIRESGRPMFSQNTLTFECQAEFRELGKKIVAKDDEIRELDNRISVAKPKEKNELQRRREALVLNRTNLITSYKALAEYAHTRAVAYLALQFLMAKPVTWANNEGDLFKALDAKITSLSGPEHATEKMFLLQMSDLIKSVLSTSHPTPQIDKKGEVTPPPGGMSAMAREKMETIVDKFDDALRPREVESQVAGRPRAGSEPKRGLEIRRAAVSKRGSTSQFP